MVSLARKQSSTNNADRRDKHRPDSYRRQQPSPAPATTTRSDPERGYCSHDGSPRPGRVAPGRAYRSRRGPEASDKSAMETRGGKRIKMARYYDLDYEHGVRRGRYEGARGFIRRAGDEVRSWFGDEEAERRRGRDEYEYDRRGRHGDYGRSGYGIDE